MSNVSNPEPVKNPGRIESDHKKLNESYVSVSKRKFEGWPILWILLILSIVLGVLWYTGIVKEFLEWIEKK